MLRLLPVLEKNSAIPAILFHPPIVAHTNPGHVKWPRTQVHYVQVSMGGYSLIPNVFQIDVEARTSHSAALFAGVLLTVTLVGGILWGYPSPLDLRY